MYQQKYGSIETTTSKPIFQIALIFLCHHRGLSFPNEFLRHIVLEYAAWIFHRCHATSWPNQLILFGLLLLISSLFTYLHTPYSTVLLEKLTGLQRVKKFSAFYGNGRIITRLRVPVTCSYPDPVNLVHASHTTSWRSSLIISSHLRLGLPSASFLQVSQTKRCMQLSCPPHELHTPPISLFSIS